MLDGGSLSDGLSTLLPYDVPIQDYPIEPSPSGIANDHESFPTAANGLPLLHSLPGAPVSVFLDFDGSGGSLGTGVFDLDGDSATFTDSDGDPDIYSSNSEQDRIRLTWERAALYFAPFDVDVTTEQPSAGQPKAWLGIGPGGCGCAFVGTFGTPSNATGSNGSGDAPDRTSGIVHEVGHIFGSSHQSEYNQYADMTAEYRGAQDGLGSVMGVDFAGNPVQWWLGHRSGNPSTLQDDIAVITGQIIPHQGGDGFRTDDHGGSLATPTVDATALVDIGGSFSTTGIVERLTDVDAFSFAWSGGDVAVTAEGVSETDTFTSQTIGMKGSSLNPRIHVFDSTGLLVGYDEPSSPTDLVVSATMDLPAGTYYAVVSGHGNYADIGQYDLNIESTTTGVASPEPSDPSVVLTLNNVTTTTTDFQWASVPGVTGYQLQRSTDAISYSGVAAVGGGATSASDSGLSAGETYVYRLRATTSGGNLYSNAITVTTLPAAVQGLVIKPWGTDSMILDWKDTDHETGYRIERSTDNVIFSTVGTVGANVPSFTDTAINGWTNYYYRVVSLNSGQDGETATGIPSLIPGDVNLNGVVNSLDVTQFVANWLADTSELSNEDRIRQGDLNRTGKTDLADAFILSKGIEAASGSALSMDYLFSNPLQGDMNNDGIVNLGDVNLFVQALTQPTTYQEDYPDIYLDYAGDLDATGTFDLGDLAQMPDLFGGESTDSASAQAAAAPSMASMLASAEVFVMALPGATFSDPESPAVVSDRPLSSTPSTDRVDEVFRLLDGDILAAPRQEKLFVWFASQRQDVPTDVSSDLIAWDEAMSDLLDEFNDLLVSL